MKSKSQGNKTINKKFQIIVAIFIGAYFLIFLRVTQLQIFEYEKYKDLSDRNVMKERSITPIRANIMDRNGVLIANNRAMYYLTITPELVNNYKKDKLVAVEKLLESLRFDIDITDEDVVRIKKDVVKNPKFIETLIKLDINEKELSTVVNKIKFISGVKVHSTFVRDYPYGNLFLHPIGYVGIASKEDYEKYENLTNLDYIGKAGIEKVYQESLHGKHGVESYKINATGRVVQSEIKDKAVSGDDLITTLDVNLQKKALELMGDEKGSIVVIDPNNGDVLVMISTPTFDSNKFIKGISQKDYDEYFKKDSPLFNRAIQGTYPPASTFKPFVALAAIEGRFVNPNEKIMCGPSYQIAGSTRKFLDWKQWGHGKINLSESLERSADVYYYKIGDEMGVDYMHDFIKHFGFGRKTGIDLIGEREGILPSSEWKMRVKKESWYRGESIISSIGQGYNLATPLQMATSMAALVNGGSMYKPKLRLNDAPILVDKINISKESVNYVKNGLSDVLHGKYGTARMAIYGEKKINFKMGGKTGTAQVYSTHGVKDKEEMANKPKHLQDHALFTGFAPFENPEIVISVVVENGESGSKTAAPMAVEIARYYMKMKAEKSELNNEVLNW